MINIIIRKLLSYTEGCTQIAGLNVKLNYFPHDGHIEMQRKIRLHLNKYEQLRYSTLVFT
jgi:hypothetical protein